MARCACQSMMGDCSMEERALVFSVAALRVMPAAELSRAAWLAMRGVLTDLREKRERTPPSRAPLLVSGAGVAK